MLRENPNGQLTQLLWDLRPGVSASRNGDALRVHRASPNRELLFCRSFESDLCRLKARALPTVEAVAASALPPPYCHADHPKNEIENCDVPKPTEGEAEPKKNGKNKEKNEHHGDFLLGPAIGPQAFGYPIHECFKHRELFTPVKGIGR
jgi:hypothetical protein